MRETAGEDAKTQDVNRLCLGCLRACKQGARCTVVSCPRHVPAREDAGARGVA